MNLGVVGQGVKLFDCPRVLKGFSMHRSCLAWSFVSPCGCRWLNLFCFFYSIVYSAERLCEGEFCCLGHCRKISALCLLCKIYHRVDHSMNKYLKHFVAARNTRASAVLGELASVTPRCRTESFSTSFLPIAVRLSCCHRACLVVAP